MTKKLTAFQRDVLGLAKAIEQGISKTRRETGNFVRFDSENAPTKQNVFACALGAAWVNGQALRKAVLGSRRGYTTELSERFPALTGSFLFDDIIHKNDTEDWSRGRIVAWLRRVAKFYPEIPESGTWELAD